MQDGEKLDLDVRGLPSINYVDAAGMFSIIPAIVGVACPLIHTM
jgi:hypothetical protein